MKYVLLGVGFNLYWFLAVWGQYQYIALLITVLIGCWLFYRCSGLYALIASPVGMMIDYGLSQTGIMTFSVKNVALAPTWSTYFTVFIPLWLILLWLGFTTFIWLMREKLLAYPVSFMAMIGSIGGAVSYWAGNKLEAISWPYGVTATLVVMGLIWLSLSIYLLWLLKVLNHWHDQRH